MYIHGYIDIVFHKYNQKMIPLLWHCNCGSSRNTLSFKSSNPPVPHNLYPPHTMQVLKVMFCSCHVDMATAENTRSFQRVTGDHQRSRVDRPYSDGYSAYVPGGRGDPTCQATAGVVVSVVCVYMCRYISETELHGRQWLCLVWRLRWV